MNLRHLGPSGLAVSEVGLGCNNFGRRIDLEQTRAVIHKALDLGITLFDTADVYGPDGKSETLMGQVIGPRRKDIVLATKFGLPFAGDKRMSGGSRRYIVQAVEASLKRLQTDWIDLYQLHDHDPTTPVEETLAALDTLIRQGKVRYVGCSNLPAWRVVESVWTARDRRTAGFISCQDEYSLLTRGAEAELLPAIEAYGLGLLPYFPLACGMLTGKYRKGAALPAGTRLANTQSLADTYMTEANWAIVERLRVYAEERGHTLLDLAFGWLLARRCVSSVIAGATKPEQLEQNVAAAGWVLTPAEKAEIDELARK